VEAGDGTLRHATGSRSVSEWRQGNSEHCTTAVALEQKLALMPACAALPYEVAIKNWLWHD
jgi:hypothetical protein